MLGPQILFDFEKGQALKADALDRLEEKGHIWLTQARAVARDHALRFGRVTADDVIAQIGKPDGHHHNLIGAIFANGEFVRVGYTQTKRPEGHARVIGVWRIHESKRG